MVNVRVMMLLFFNILSNMWHFQPLGFLLSFGLFFLLFFFICFNPNYFIFILFFFSYFIFNVLIILLLLILIIIIFFFFLQIKEISNKMREKIKFTIIYYASICNIAKIYPKKNCFDFVIVTSHSQLNSKIKFFS